MYAGWVLAPFALLAWGHTAAKRWSASSQAMLEVTSLAVAVGSLAIYAGVAFGPPRPQPAAFFLMTPFASLLVVTVILLCARARRGAG